MDCERLHAVHTRGVRLEGSSVYRFFPRADRVHLPFCLFRSCYGSPAFLASSAIGHHLYGALQQFLVFQVFPPLWVKFKVV